MKNPFIPTEAEVLKHAHLVNGDDAAAKESFILAVWLTVSQLPEPKEPSTDA
jgi:hypothetical protein